MTSDRPDPIKALHDALSLLDVKAARITEQERRLAQIKDAVTIDEHGEVPGGSHYAIGAVCMALLGWTPEH